MLNFYDFIQVYVFTINHHLKPKQPTTILLFVNGSFQQDVGWLLVSCFGPNGHLRPYFSLYRAVSQREGERKEK